MSNIPRKPEKIIEEALSIDDVSTHSGKSDVNAVANPSVERLNQKKREPGKVEAEAAQVTEQEDSGEHTKKTIGYALKAKKEPSVGKRIGYFTVLISFTVWSLYEAVNWNISKWHESIFVGLVTSIFLFSILSFLAYLITGEVKAFLAIKKINKGIHKAANETYSDEQANDYIHRILKTIKLDKPDVYEDFVKVSKNRSETDELVSLFKNTVLVGIDKEVDQQIEQYAKSSGITVAVLPHPALDALVIIIQAIRMTKTVGTLYGVRTGFFTSAILMRETIKNILLLTSIDFVSEVLADEFSAGVAGKAGKGIAKGAVIYYRVRRLGNATKKLCRPDF